MSNTWPEQEHVNPELGSTENILMNYGCSRQFIDRVLGLEKKLDNATLVQNQLDRIEAKLDQLLAKKKRVVKPRGSGLECSDFFNELWLTYPKRAGSNPKRKAYSAYCQRVVEEGVDKINIYHGVQRYSDYCDETGKTHTEFVMQAATFFGPDKHYENDWTIPKPTADPYAKPDVYSQAHQSVDVDKIGRGDADLDESQHPYGDMK